MPETPDLKFAFNLPPAEAIKWFESKGYAVTWDWEEQVGAAHNRAFTVAKAMTLDILQTVREGVSRALAEGQSERSFKQNLEPLLKQKGWWGRQTVEGPDGEETVTLGSPYRLKTIYQTNLQTAMMAGRQKDFLENVDDRPFFQYVSMIDASVRPSHLRLNGRVFRYDDPFWNHFWPPIDWRCRCRVRALSQRDIERRDLVVESSAGLLSDTDKLLSIRSGITVKTPLLRDPLGDITPGAGFGYNKLDMSWHPDLEKYDAQLAREHVKATLKGESFIDFIEGRSEADFPVGILTPQQMAAQGTNKQTLYLRQQDLDPALSVEDYQKIPELLEAEDLGANVGDSLLRLVITGVTRLFARLFRA